MQYNDIYAISIANFLRVSDKHKSRTTEGKLFNDHKFKEPLTES